MARTYLSEFKENPTKMGLTIALGACLFYSPFIGYLTSYSIAAESIRIAYNCTELQTVVLNSVAFTSSIGLGPLFLRVQYFMDRKLGVDNNQNSLYYMIISGYLISTISLILSSFIAQNFWHLLFTYSIITSIGNNFVYMGLNYMVNNWLSARADASKWLPTAAVIISCAVSVGTFGGNQLTAMLLNYLVDDLFSAARRRFLYAGIIIFFDGCVFAIVLHILGKSPPSTQDENRQVSLEIDEQRRLQDVEVHAEIRSERSERSDSSESSLLLVRNAQKPLTLAYFIATFSWGMIFTTPYTLGKDYIRTKYNTSLGSMNFTAEQELLELESIAATIAYMGISEFVSRIFVILVGPKIPDERGFYAFIYSVCSVMVGLICLLLTIPVETWFDFDYYATKFFTNVLFLSLPLPMGVMNCLVLPAGKNIFGDELNKKLIFPWGNTFLAIGFGVGPIVFSWLNGAFGIEFGFRAAGLAVLGAAGLFAVIGFVVSRD